MRAFRIHSRRGVTTSSPFGLAMISLNSGAMIDSMKVKSRETKACPQRCSSDTISAIAGAFGKAAAAASKIAII